MTQFIFSSHKLSRETSVTLSNCSTLNFLFLLVHDFAKSYVAFAILFDSIPCIYSAIVLNMTSTFDYTDQPLTLSRHWHQCFSDDQVEKVVEKINASKRFCPKQRKDSYSLSLFVLIGKHAQRNAV